jgi:hypothetical protein
MAALRSPSRGQSVIELALIAPIIVGLLGLTMQAGLLISDQVQLQHYAYEGGQWAFANLATATVDPNSTTAGTIGQHVLQQMCGGSASVPSTTGSRFCRAEPSGIPNLTVSVTRRATPTAFDFGLVQEADAAGTCKVWALTATAIQTVDAGSSVTGTATYTISLASVGAIGGDVAVTLAAGNYPNNYISGSFADPRLYTDPTKGPTSTTFTFVSRSDTQVGSYTLAFTGQDDCTPSTSFATYATLVVKPPLTLPTPVASNLPSIDSIAASVLPIYICVGVNITILGHNFQPGAKVYIGRNLATTVTVTGTGQIVAFFASLPDGGVDGLKQDITVTNPDGTSTTMLNAVTVMPGPCTGTPPNTSDDCVANCTQSNCTSNCGGGGGGNCVSHCSQAGCTSNCRMPLCVSDCQMPNCTSGCVQPACRQNCGAPNCSTCQIPNCSSSCNFPSCSGGTCGGAPTTPNTSCAGAAGHYQTVITITWNEPLIIPLLTGSSPPYVKLKATEIVYCQ